MFKKITSLSVIGLIFLATSAFSANQQFCGNYARTAVAQFKFAKKNHCGIPTNKNGWYAEFNYPYAWCRESTEKQANQQTKNRYSTIGSCMMKRAR